MIFHQNMYVGVTNLERSTLADPLRVTMVHLSFYERLLFCEKCSPPPQQNNGKRMIQAVWRKQAPHTLPFPTHNKHPHCQQPYSLHMYTSYFLPYIKQYTKYKINKCLKLFNGADKQDLKSVQVVIISKLGTALDKYLTGF